jgi:hypothetical protein
MADLGVTGSGFVIKTLSAILADKADRAREMFGADIDLRSTSAFRKVLDISSAEDHNLWKEMERFYYAGFHSTASADALDLLGEDAGVARRFLTSHGSVKLKVTSAAKGRIYNLPIGTLLETNAPVQFFRTLALVSLSAEAPEKTVDVEALQRGPAGNVAANVIAKVNAIYAQRNLNLGPAVIEVKNEAATAGGEIQEDDESYRALLLGYPRTIWTIEAVRRAVKAVDGVRDCRVFDPLGGVDVSQSRFKAFAFAQRRFGTQRLLGTPYFFDILVAIYPGFPFESQPGVVGVQEAIANAIRELRPIGIFPNIRRANNVVIGLRTRIFIKSGHDRQGVVAAIKDRLSRRVNAQGLGNSVQFSDVHCDCRSAPGVTDVQELHLRRCPPEFAGISFGRRVRFQAETIEAAVGENIDLTPNEIAVFRIDSDLIQIDVSDR